MENLNREIKAGETIEGYTFKYGVIQKVIDIYGWYIKFRTPAALDGIGTFDAKEDVQELKRLVRMGAIS